MLCAGNDREKSGSEAGIGARRDPEGRQEKGLTVARRAGPEHGEREGNTAHPSRPASARSHRRAAAPPARAAPAQGGRSLGLFSGTGPARPKGIGPSCRGAPPA